MREAENEDTIKHLRQKLQDNEEVGHIIVKRLGLGLGMGIGIGIGIGRHIKKFKIKPWEIVAKMQF